MLLIFVTQQYLQLLLQSRELLLQGFDLHIVVLLQGLVSLLQGLVVLLLRLVVLLRKAARIIAIGDFKRVGIVKKNLGTRYLPYGGHIKANRDSFNCRAARVQNDAVILRDRWWRRPGGEDKSGGT